MPGLTQASVNIDLNEPGTLFNDSVDQLDVSVTKSFRKGGYELRPELSLFNALNAYPVFQNNQFGTTLNNALSIERHARSVSA